MQLSFEDVLTLAEGYGGSPQVLEVVIFYIPLIKAGELSEQAFFETVLLGIKLGLMSDKYKDMMDEGFLMEVKELHMAMDELIEKYDLRGR